MEEICPALDILVQSQGSQMLLVIVMDVSL